MRARHSRSIENGQKCFLTQTISALSLSSPFESPQTNWFFAFEQSQLLHDWVSNTRTFMQWISLRQMKSISSFPEMTLAATDDFGRTSEEYLKRSERHPHPDQFFFVTRKHRVEWCKCLCVLNTSQRRNRFTFLKRWKTLLHPDHSNHRKCIDVLLLGNESYYTIGSCRWNKSIHVGNFVAPAAVD